MSTALGVEHTPFYSCDIKLSSSLLDARQLAEFASSQMPRTGTGEVPWSTPLSSEQLATLAKEGKAELITARMQLVADGLQELPLIGIGALIRDPNQYPTPRMVVVTDIESRKEGIGTRIANELLQRLQPGETVQAEVQTGAASVGSAARFFEKLGFSRVEENHRVAAVPEYLDGQRVGSVERTFALYELTKGAEEGSLPANFRNQ